MHLVNMPRLRVKKHPRGWVVEREFKTWYGKNYWKHIEAVSGIESEPWYYKTIDIAVEEAAKHFSWDLYHGHAMHT